MSNLSLNHFSIRSLEIEKTTAFYSELLGLTIGPRPEFPFPGVWLYNGDENDWANAVLHLIAIDKNDPNGLKQYLGERDPATLFGSGAVDHIAFFATGLADKLALLKKMGTPFKERSVPVLKLHQIFLNDPNGIVIELNYPAEEKLALDA
ncbi:VOC family protein [Polynucleobacter brandtiae]|uniref:Catechol 2,3-dioxygenase-like lactoylglutathione lyase family enzyme n=1 Tax=Polynucleobacter brandtiae TaxID=1938816 RepID=A0A2M8VYS2_9BURK|nr:VOC family protein [Polynucleobacter brandtiae]PJI82993.1 catechol 2,3-dioxygenase-like lactoylglutathione lyase family enzyme [Polynucleobacter brandtiae]